MTGIGVNNEGIIEDFSNLPLWFYTKIIIIEKIEIWIKSFLNINPYFHKIIKFWYFISFKQYN